jgi:hypothetical protein
MMICHQLQKELDGMMKELSRNQQIPEKADDNVIS